MSADILQFPAHLVRRRSPMVAPALPLKSLADLVADLNETYPTFHPGDRVFDTVTRSQVVVISRNGSLYVIGFDGGTRACRCPHELERPKPTPAA